MKLLRTTFAGIFCLALCTGMLIPVHGEECDHDYVEKREEPTCTQPGESYFECAKCRYQSGHQNLMPLGHAFGEWETVLEATCENAGEEIRICIRCGDQESHAILATGHDFKIEIVAPTCAKDGYTLHTCRTCGATEKTDYTDATGHDYKTEIVAPTCTKDGYTQHTCRTCGATEKTDYTDAAGHDYKTEVIAPTCTKNGYTLHTCCTCGATEKTDYTDAAGHEYKTEVVAPTCTKDGYTLHTCRTCGATQKSDPKSKTGHHYDDGVVTKEATTTAMGRITYTCQGCGDTYTETTPKLVNPFEDVKPSAYYFTPVIWAANKGITGGVDETHFGPNAFCTRAQVVTFLWRAAGSPEPETTDCPFVDVAPGSYYYKAVLWAKERGITSGVGAARFGGNLVCTRAQVVTFLYRAKGNPAWETVNRFSDVGTEDYYYQSVCWAADNGVTSGVDGGRFGPDMTCTRAQIVTFLYRSNSI